MLMNHTLLQMKLNNKMIETVNEDYRNTKIKLLI